MQPIAIIGMACRFPGAATLEAYWGILRDGKTLTSEVPAERWNIEQFYDPQPATAGKMNTRYGAFLSNVDLFDPEFFGISEREARMMDPQQRLMLELAWEALENAGIAPDSLAGSRTGVFLGVGNSDYNRMLFRDVSRLEHFAVLGTWSCFAPNRISYHLDLKGPSLAIDTACSSSLVAIHMAAQSLACGESDLAIAGGVNLLLSPENTVAISQGRAMAPDGRCKTFDAGANGYVRAEGGGLVILKRLSETNSDIERVWAVIRGSAVNQDGLTNGLSAPNGPAQVAVIRQALANSGTQGAEISYVEAHGSGTVLGDPIEFKSLKKALSPGRANTEPCWVGSVKTNIGHLETAAGVAGLIKVVLALNHEMIPAHLNFQRLNPYISLSDSPFQIPVQPVAWKMTGHSRRAGVSSFGAGGTNCHMIVEEAAVAQPQPEHAQPRLLTLRAKSAPALRELADRYLAFLQLNPKLPLGSFCSTANAGRAQFRHRLAVTGNSREEFCGALQDFLDSTPNDCIHAGEARKHPKVALIFTGDTTAMEGDAAEFYETNPKFRAALDACDADVQAHFGESIGSLLKAAGTVSGNRLSAVARSELRHFLLSYGLASLWTEWGVEFQVAFGHGVGEVAAASISGSLSLDEALTVVRFRISWLEALPDMETALILAGESRTNELIAPLVRDISIVMRLGPERTVVAGTSHALAALRGIADSAMVSMKRLKSQGIIPAAWQHRSPSPEPQLPVLGSRPKAIRLISSLTGNMEKDEAIFSAAHLFGPVQAARAFHTMRMSDCDIFLGIGAQTLVLADEELREEPRTGIWIDCMPARNPIVAALARFSTFPIALNWRAIELGFGHRGRLSLPTYPFQRRRYWAHMAPTPGESSLMPTATKAVLAPANDLKNSGAIKSNEPANPENTAGTGANQSTGTRLLQELRAAVPAQRQPLLRSYLKDAVAGVLGMTEQPVDLEEPLTCLGLDSLTGLLLRTRIAADSGVDVPIAKFLAGITAAELAAFIEQETIASPEQKQTVQGAAVATASATVNGLAEADLMEGQL